jgi:hypothetical protein
VTLVTLALYFAGSNPNQHIRRRRWLGLDPILVLPDASAIRAVVTTEAGIDFGPDHVGVRGTL